MRLEMQCVGKQCKFLSRWFSLVEWIIKKYLDVGNVIMAQKGVQFWWNISEDSLKKSVHKTEGLGAS